jgi:hypothetical protein
MASGSQEAFVVHVGFDRRDFGGQASGHLGQQHSQIVACGSVSRSTQ